MEETITYQDMETLLRRANCQYSAAEIQGMACGLLAIDMNADAEKWLEHIFPERDPQNALQQDISNQLKHYLHQLRIQLQDSNLGFELLLPDDNEMLEDRVDAMQEWTQGFLLGIALAGLKDFQNLPEDSKELLDDFIEISKVEAFTMDDNSETSEDDYLQIVEYLRMGVLLIAEELQPGIRSVTLH